MTENSKITETENRTRAAYRGVSGDIRGEVSFYEGQAFLIAGNPRFSKRSKIITARLPSPTADIPIERQPHLRGAADSNALYRRYHDEKITQQNSRLNDPDHKALSDILEQVRCEALGVSIMPGVARNMTASLEYACEKKGYREHESADREVVVPLAEGLYALAFEGLTGCPLGSAAAAVANQWRMPLIAKHGVNPFEDLAKYIDDQAIFMKLAESFVLRLTGGDISPDTENDTDGDQQNAATGEGAYNIDDHDLQQVSDPAQNTPSNSVVQSQQDEQDLTGDQGESEDQNTIGNNAFQGVDHNVESGEGAAGRPKQRHVKAYDLLSDRDRIYTIYRSEYDEIADAHKLASADELRQLRQILDRQLEPLQNLIGKMANRLQRRLLAKQQRQWQFDLDDKYQSFGAYHCRSDIARYL